MAQPREDGAFHRVPAETAAPRSQELPAGGQPRLTRLLSRPRATRPLQDRLELPERARMRLRIAVTVLLFAGVLATAGGILAVDLTHRPRAGDPPAATALASTSPARTIPAGAVPGGSLPPGTIPAGPAAGGPAARTDPFAGSPAQSYASGPDGIVLPAPHPVGRYSAAQVGRAYRIVKQMLAAAHLDRRTLRGGAPAAFARLLTPAERSYFDQRLGSIGLTAQGWPRSSRDWVTSFAPGSVQFATGTVRVHGTMRAAAATGASGRPVLRVTADYLFVYAVQRPGRPASRMRVVVRDVVWVDFGHWNRLHGPLEPWWSPHGGGTTGGLCGTRDGFIHPAFPGGPRRIRPSGRPVDPYNQSVAPSGQGCRPATGT